MRAALFTEFGGPLNIETVADPDCPVDGLIVAVEACGVCRSDHHAWKGADPDVDCPHVPGHELAGIVVDVGKGCTRFQKGDRITAPFILSCGTCSTCVSGDPTTCPHQHVIGFSGYGAFAESVAVPHADFNVLHLPDAIDFAEAAAMGCRMTTAFRALTDRAQLVPGEWLAVYGCGGVGLSAIKIAAALGAAVVAIDISEDALKLAQEFGATAVINAKSNDLTEQIMEITGGGAHVAVDALGATVTFHNALACLRPMGRYVQIGMPTGKHAEPTIKIIELVYSRQLSLFGTRGLPSKRFPALFQMIEADRLSLDGLATKRIRLEEAGAALAAMDGAQPAGVTVIDRF